MSNVLTWITFLPMIGVLLILFVPKTSKNLIRIMAAVVTGLQLMLAVWIYLHFDTSTAEFQFREQYSWIPSFNIEYFMGIDGLSIPMVLLTAFLSFICNFASWRIDKNIKG